MIGRLSLNQITIGSSTLAQAVEGCVRHGIPWIAPWRHKVAEVGLAEGARLIRDAGLRVSSLCRGGMFPAATASERATRLEDNRRAVDEAAALGADLLVLVCGPAPGRDLDGGRAMVEDGIAAIAPYARERGVRLGIEPLHPMFAADRSVIVTLRQALNMAEKLAVGVVIDTYHVWWDPELYTQIARARERIFGFHVSDWIVPLPDTLMGRGMMGDGVIEIRRIRQAVDAAGYSGPVEVEIFNQALWDMPPDDALRWMRERYLGVV